MPDIVINILAILGGLASIAILTLVIFAVIIFIKAKKSIKKAEEDPEYAKDMKDELAKYHTNKFLNQGSKCCEEEEHANQMLFERKYKRTDNDHSSDASKGRTEPPRS